MMDLYNQSYNIWLEPLFDDAMENEKPNIKELESLSNEINSPKRSISKSKKSRSRSRSHHKHHHHHHHHRR